MTKKIMSTKATTKVAKVDTNQPKVNFKSAKAVASSRNKSADKVKATVALIKKEAKSPSKNKDCV